MAAATCISAVWPIKSKSDVKLAPIYLLLLVQLMATTGQYANAQVLIGHVQGKINFREGPGLDYGVIHTLDQSMRLVVLPREVTNGFVEVFDIESSSRGYVARHLITVTDTLRFTAPQIMERVGETASGGDVEVVLVNRTDRALYVWLNGFSYHMDPFEKKSLVFPTLEFTYFCSAPGFFPVMGKERVNKGSLYTWECTAQDLDTLNVTIQRLSAGTLPAALINQTDSIGKQPPRIDTSLRLADVNPQDMGESRYQLKIYGSVRVNGFYDFNGMESTEGFKPYEIPVGVQKVPGLSGIYIGARQTRFGLEGIGNTKVGAITTYLEVDFVSNVSSFLRLRHAFAEWNFFKMGYTWTTFMDNSALPITVDLEGPNSSLLRRHGLIRFEKRVLNRSLFGVSLESPPADYFNPGDTAIQGFTQQRNLDLAARYRYAQGDAHIQIAGIYRKIDVFENNRMQVAYGWGLMLSTAVKLAPAHRVSGQYTIGSGIAHYFVGFIDKQLDAIYNPTSQTMNLLGIQGGFLSYTYLRSPEWNFSVTTGLSSVDNFAFQTDDAFGSSHYFAINAFYNPIETIRIGLELTGGSRTNKDGRSGDASRMALLAKYNF